MSLGGGIASDFERSAFQTFFDDGILSVAAAGNYGNASYSYPASYSSVMSVAATDSNDAIASFSQYNDEVDIAAPGVSIVSTVGATPARRPQRRRSPIALTAIIVSYYLGPPSDTGVGPPDYGWMSGTSMATPHVAGLAMVLWNK